MKMHKEGVVTKWAANLQQSEVSFEVRHLMVSHVKGDFSQFEASVLTNGNDFSTADITLKIFGKSIDTDDSKRDAELKGSDFLWVDEYRQITFSSTSIAKTGSSRMLLRGNLAIAGRSRDVAFDMHMGLTSTDSWGDETACLIITGKLNRDDWDIKWTTAMQAAGFLIGDQLNVFCRLELYSVEQHNAAKTNNAVSETRTIAMW